MKNLISIIIVNYNGKKWLRKLFDSLLSQTYKNFEIIFVDNGSSDGSVEFVKNNYKDDRIKIIKSDKNLGFAGGNNLGIKSAKGEYILLLNNDTWIENNFLERIISFYKNNNFDVVGPYGKDYENTKKFEKYWSTIDFLGHPVYLKNKKKCNNFYLSGVCIFFSKDLYQKTLGLDNDFFMYFEETDWFWRLNLLNKKFSHIDNLYVYHAGAGSTGKGIKYTSFLWRNQNTLQMLLKNYRWFNLSWVLPIYFIQNIFEILFFLLILKPKISLSYIQGWWFNIVNFKKIMQKRKWVQENRLIGDFEIMGKMYIGFGKIKHLLNYYKNYYKNNESKKSL
jgi:GT2 family glycosyltransferase